MVKYLYNIEDGLKNTHDNIKSLKTNPHVISGVLIGNSVMRGVQAGDTFSEWEKYGWVTKASDKFKGIYEDVGTGSLPDFYKWVYSGTWYSQTGSYGIHSRNHYTNENGATATLTFNGPGEALIYQQRPEAGTMDILVDGQLITTLNMYGATSLTKRYDITGLTPGDHVLTVRKTSDGKWNHIIGAFELKGSCGVRFHNMGLGGARTSMLVDAGITTMNQQNIWNHSFTVIALVINDILANMDLNQFKANYRKLIEAALPNGDVLLVTPGMVASDTADNFVNVVHELREEYNIALMDLYAKYGGDRNIMQNREQIMATSSDIHWNRKGHDDASEKLFGVINPPFERTPIERGTYINRELIRRDSFDRDYDWLSQYNL